MGAMYPILGRLPHILVYSYTVVWGVTILLTVGFTLWHSDKQPQLNGWFDGLLCMLAGALVGGRVGFIWANQNYFAEHPYEIPTIFAGGLLYHGALAGGMLCFWLWTRLTKRPFYPYAILLTPALLVAHTAGWLACLLEGCAYGRATFLSWYTADLPDSFGVYAIRYPTQLMGIMLCTLLTIIILRWVPPTGRRFWLALAGLNFIHGLIALWRGDTLPLLWGIRSDLLFAAFVCVVALIFALLLPHYQRITSL